MYVTYISCGLISKMLLGWKDHSYPSKHRRVLPWSCKKASEPSCLERHGMTSPYPQLSTAYDKVSKWGDDSGVVQQLPLPKMMVAIPGLWCTPTGLRSLFFCSLPFLSLWWWAPRHSSSGSRDGKCSAEITAVSALETLVFWAEKAKRPVTPASVETMFPCPKQDRQVLNRWSPIRWIPLPPQSAQIAMTSLMLVTI